MIRALVLLLTALVLIGCGSVPDYAPQGAVIEADPAGATASAGAFAETGGTGAGTTGGSRETGGERETGGTAAAGASPVGGAGGNTTGGTGSETSGSTGGSETGGSPSCSWPQAVNGLPTSWTWNGWSARNDFEGRCAECVTSPCGTAELDVLELGEQGVTVSLGFETPPELRGGNCGGLDQQCELTGTNADAALIHLEWQLEPTASGWQAVPAPSDPDSWTNPQCYVQPGLDLEPWSRASMLEDLMNEFSAFIETVEWECP